MSKAGETAAATGPGGGGAGAALPPRQAPDEAVAAIRQALARGAPWEACDAFRAAAGEAAQADPELLYWGALAQARAGAAATARALLDAAEAAGAGRSIELLEMVRSLRGRLAKDRLAHGGDAARRAAAAQEALAAYAAAYALRGDPFPGINAASMAWLAGGHARATALAGEVRVRLAAVPPPLDLWHHATLGEAALLMGDAPAARAAYAAAAEAAGADVGSTGRMRAQLRLLAPTLPLADELLALVPAPAVLAFAGHMIDAPGRSPPRFPAVLAPAVGAALHAWLRAAHRPIVCTSAACGADLLLIEAAQALGAEVTIVLPFDREDFVGTSVAPGGPEWVHRFERALAGAHRVLMATDEAYLGDVVLFDHAARLVEGLAVARAGQLATEATLLAVLAGQGGGAAPAGGTVASVRRWRAARGEPAIIDLDAIAAAHGLSAAARAGVTPFEEHAASRGMAAPPPTSAPTSAPTLAPTLAPEPAHTPAPAPHQRAIRTLLFADVRGFSSLRDTHAPLFHARFFDAVAACISASVAPPVHANTWGDALFAVFDRPQDGAAFAWSLLERVRAIDWSAAGLGTQGQLRISLHAGPVFKGWDPVTHRDSYFGSIVTQAARIEPVTQPDTLYASEVFAALLAGEGDDHGYALEYLGSQQLAKGYGTMRLYRLDRPG